MHSRKHGRCRCQRMGKQLEQFFFFFFFRFCCPKVFRS
jgi:hypothetical protein